MLTLEAGLWPVGADVDHAERLAKGHGKGQRSPQHLPAAFPQASVHMYMIHDFFLPRPARRLSVGLRAGLIVREYANNIAANVPGELLSISH